MNWFEAITGFPEATYAETQRRLRVADGKLTSDVCSKLFKVGTLVTPSLSELRERTAKPAEAGATRFSVVQGDVRKLHAAPENANALFQVASQFNLLEMVGPTCRLKTACPAMSSIGRRGRRARWQ
ncbi:MAG: hypothetical protein V4669_17820 [Pseudomonadota bacterium]|jgi:hypothetical protein